MLCCTVPQRLNPRDHLGLDWYGERLQCVGPKDESQQSKQGDKVGPKARGRLADATVATSTTPRGERLGSTKGAFGFLGRGRLGARFAAQSLVVTIQRTHLRSSLSLPLPALFPRPPSTIWHRRHRKTRRMLSNVQKHIFYPRDRFLVRTWGASTPSSFLSDGAHNQRLQPAYVLPPRWHSESAVQ